MSILTTAGVPFSVRGDILQGKKINSGKSGVIFYYEIPSDYTGFIYELANSHYLNTYLIFEIDGETVEVLYRSIASLNTPKYFDRPFEVKFNIKFTAFNESDKDHYFGALADGLLYPKRLFED